VELVPQTGHAGTVTDITYSPDGLLLASAGVDFTVKLWDVATGRELHTLLGHVDDVRNVAFGPDGRWIASASTDRTINVWDVATGERLWSSPRHDRGIHALAVDLVAGWIASASDDSIRIWDWKKGGLLRSLPVLARSLAFSPDGRWLVLTKGAGYATELWRTATWDSAETFMQPDDDPYGATVTRDGRWVLSVHDSTVQVREVGTWKVLRLVVSRDFAGEAAVHPAGDWLATESRSRTVVLWRLRDGLESRELPGDSASGDSAVERSITAIAFSPDGKHVAAARINGTITIWDVATGSGQRMLASASVIMAGVAFSPRGDSLVLRDVQGNTYSVTTATGPGDLIRGESVAEHPVWSPEPEYFGRFFGYSLNGGWLAAGDTEDRDRTRPIAPNAPVDSVTLALWEVASGRRMRAIGPFPGQLSNVVFGPRAQFLAAKFARGRVVVWNLSTNQVRQSADRAQDTLLALSADGHKLAWGAPGGRLVITETGSGRELIALLSDDFAPGRSLFSFDGRWLASASRELSDRNVRVWDVASGREIAHLRGAVGGFWTIADLAFSPDGELLAWVNGPGTIQVWRVRAEEQLCTLRGYAGRIEGLAFSPDGHLLASAGRDGTVRIWETGLCQPLATIVVLKESLGWLVMDPDGFFDGTPQAWSRAAFRLPGDPMKLYEPEQFFSVFYQPGLLADVLRSGKRVRQILQADSNPRANVDISSYMRSPLPETRIRSPQSGTVHSERVVTVEVEVRDRGSGLRDLRLFRNGALVHFEHGELRSDAATGMYRLAIPVRLVPGKNELTAYVFNGANLKSRDASITITAEARVPRRGRAHIIAVGVDRYANADYNLRYAVADARAVASNLARTLKTVWKYVEVDTTVLVDAAATKQNVLTALNRLASSTGERVRRAEPEDLVLFYFAGHGMSRGDRYFLIPHDLGYQGGLSALDDAGYATLAAHSISDRELESALENIDAGEVILVIDACYSGRALEAEEQRRGPMNSRGLAQLAYEKGMYILTAAQEYQTALEAARLGHGLLTYALTTEGLQRGLADSTPRDGEIGLREWLDFGVRRVPALHREMLTPTWRAHREVRPAHARANRWDVQRPRLFSPRESMGSAAVVAYRGADKAVRDGIHWYHGGEYVLAWWSFRQAAASGHVAATNYLGFMSETGRGVVQDYGEAARWYRAAANKGNRVAMTNLARLYVTGLGVVRDYGRAAHWYLEGARASNPRAMGGLGYLFERGWGVRKNFGDAVRWYRRGAQAGDPWSMCFLALALSEGGPGTPTNQAASTDWFRQASLQLQCPENRTQPPPPQEPVGSEGSKQGGT
jgi:WD40 repeat protein